MSPLPDIRRLVRQGAEEALRDAAEEVLREARRRAPKGAPEEDPDPSVSLEDSGRIEVRRGGRVMVVSFDTPYAAYQHENQHLSHPRGGQAKYLEDALKHVLPKLEGAVAGKVRKHMTGAGRRG